MRREPMAGPEPRGVPVDPLGAPAGARARARRWLDPVSGRVRRLERAVNLYLSRTVFPRWTWVRGAYDRVLDRDLHCSEADLEVRGLGTGLDGLRVLLVTDVHASTFVSQEGLERTFRRLATLDAEVVLLGGDLLTGRPEEIDVVAPALRRIRAPLGTYAVAGNHDHYATTPDRLRRALESCGVRLLVNRHVRLERDGAGLTIAGIDDWNAGVPDLEAALEGRDPRDPTVLLSHNPDAAFAAAAQGVDVVLSGHTHAGQIRVPGLPVLVRMSRYRLDEGRYRAGRTEIVVSRGLGVVGVPVRIACPPEVVLLRLRRAAGASGG